VEERATAHPSPPPPAPAKLELGCAGSVTEALYVTVELPADAEPLSATSAATTKTTVAVATPTRDDLLATLKKRMVTSLARPQGCGPGLNGSTLSA
jgi:hypothetical protein